jgi:hypothetical protein
MLQAMTSAWQACSNHLPTASERIACELRSAQAVTRRRPKSQNPQLSLQRNQVAELIGDLALGLRLRVAAFCVGWAYVFGDTAASFIWKRANSGQSQSRLTAISLWLTARPNCWQLDLNRGTADAPFDRSSNRL